MGVIDRHVRERRVGNFYKLTDLFTLMPSPLNIDIHINGNRRSADAYDIGVKTDQITDEDRLFELERVHRHRHHSALGAPCGRDTAGDIDMGHDPAAEDIALAIGVGRHRDHAYRWLVVFKKIFVGHFFGPCGNQCRIRNSSHDRDSGSEKYCRSAQVAGSGKLAPLSP